MYAPGSFPAAVQKRLALDRWHFVTLTVILLHIIEYTFRQPEAYAVAMVVRFLTRVLRKNDQKLNKSYLLCNK